MVEEEEEDGGVLCVSTAFLLQFLGREADDVGRYVDHDLLHLRCLEEDLFDFSHLRVSVDFRVWLPEGLNTHTLTIGNFVNLVHLSDDLLELAPHVA